MVLKLVLSNVFILFFEAAGLCPSGIVRFERALTASLRAKSHSLVVNLEAVRAHLARPCWGLSPQERRARRVQAPSQVAVAVVGVVGRGGWADRTAEPSLAEV